MQAEQALGSLSQREIVERCREETARYRRGDAIDDRFCFEVFRRAVAEHVEACWDDLQGIYGDQVLAWCRRASGAAGDLQELAALTWEKFWRHFTTEKLATAGGSAAVLRYLKMCAQSSVVDSVRGSTPARSLDETETEVTDTSPLPGDEQAGRAASEEFWKLVDGCLRDRRERILVYFTYELALKPVEIQAQRPDLFPSIKDVYQMTRNVLDRLRRNPDLRAWLEGEGAE